MASVPRHSSWRLSLPVGMYEVEVPSPPECSSMAHLRGEIASGASAFGVLSTRERSGGSAKRLATQLASEFVEPRDPRAVRVSGSRRAARVDGLIDMEEGLSEDGVERISIVVAELRKEFVVLTIRTRLADEVGAVIEALIESFSVEPV